MYLTQYIMGQVTDFSFIQKKKGHLFISFECFSCVFFVFFHKTGTFLTIYLTTWFEKKVLIIKVLLRLPRTLEQQ